MTYCYVRLYFVLYLYICFSSMLNVGSSDSLVDKLTLISYLNDWLVLDDKVCESSTSSNRINSSNSLNSNVWIAFLLYGEIVIIIEIKNVKWSLPKVIIFGILSMLITWQGGYKLLKINIFLKQIKFCSCMPTLHACENFLQ